MRTLGLVIDEDASGHDYPKAITVRLTTAEAALIATMVGATNGSQRDSIFRGGAEVGSAIYDCLSDTFNRYYEDGVNEAVSAVAAGLLTGQAS